MLGEEPYGNYNRILLSDVLNGRREAHEIFLHPSAWYAENDVVLHAGDRAISIDREHREVVTASGARFSYDTLLLATGSRAHVPPVEGLSRPGGGWKAGVFVFRTLEDCRRIRAHASGCCSVAVVGGGLLGLEAARGLMEQGMEVHLVHRGAHLMDRQLDTEAGEILRTVVEELGVQVHLGRETTAVLGENAVEGLAFRQGASLPCEMVVLACGVRPNVELAVKSGLRVERAVVVDDQMRTSDPRIFAVGECAQHRGEVYGIVAPLWEQAAVLADHLTGRNPGAAYHGSRVATRLKVMGVELATMGASAAEDGRNEIVRYSEPRRGVYKKLVIRDERLVGAVLLGDAARAPYLMQLFDRGTALPAERAALLFDLGGAGGQTDLAQWPDEAAVCHCNGVSKGDIQECIEGGACGFHDVMCATRAGTGCGSCKTLVRALVDRCVRQVHPSPSLTVEAPGLPCLAGVNA